ncbi:MAG TPA: phosphatidylglycerophosphatase A [Bacteroidetes bacterium]|nr:phosphatidylglycerophosphatase A [Bacteroidota bacterium]
MRTIQYWLATGLLSGLSPLAPGTAGSLLILLILYVANLDFLQMFVLSLLLFVLGVWASGAVASREGKKDPSKVVIDEMAGMAVSLLLAPHSWLAYGVAFAFFRLFDIRKPFPIRHFERLPGGWGIMLDDVVAGFYSLVIIVVLRIAGVL